MIDTATTIDNRIVEMQFNNRQFEQNIGQSILSLDKLKKGLDLDGAVKGFDRLEQAVRSVTFDPIVSGLEELSDQFSAVSNVWVRAVNRIKDAAIDAGVSLAKSLSLDQITAGMSKYEAETASIATMRYAIEDGMTEEGTKKIYDKIELLQKYADETSYSFSTMVDNMGKFVNAGVDLDKAEESMEGIANWAAKSGVSAQSANFGRVMYNLSQAMGSGTVKLMDWMSIENAQMATMEFKEQVMEAAVACGTLAKEGDKYYTKASKGHKKVEVTAKDMRNSLQNGWFTADVLTKVLGKYADRTQDFGMEAFLAAQQARTFTDAIEATKDAVSTNWARSFRLIFGDINEATQFFTDLANAMIEVTGGIDDFRNSILEGWSNNGGRNALIDSFWRIWSILGAIKNSMVMAFGWTQPFVEEMGEKLANLTKRLDETTEYILEMFETVETFTNKGGQTTGKTINRVTDDLSELQKYAQESEKSVRGMISSKMKPGTVDTFTALADAYKDLDEYIATGSVDAEVLAQKLKNIQDLNTKAGKTNKLTPWKQRTLKDMDKMVKRFQKTERHTEEATEGISSSVEQSEADATRYSTRLMRVFAGLRDFFGIFTDAAEEVKKGVIELAAEFRPLLLPILDVAAAIGDLTGRFRRNLKSNRTFAKHIQRLKNAFSPLTDKIGSAVEWLQKLQHMIFDRDYSSGKGTFEFFTGPTGEKLKTIFGGIGSAIEMANRALSHLVYFGSTLMSHLVIPLGGKFGTWLIDKISAIGGWITRVNEALERNNIFQKIRDGIDGLGKWLDENLDPVLEKIDKFISPITSTIEKFFGNTGEGIINAINVDTSEEETLKGKIALRLQAFSNAFADENGEVPKIVTAIKDFFKPITDAIDALFGKQGETTAEDAEAQAVDKQGMFSGVVEAVKGMMSKFSELAKTGDVGAVVLAAGKVFLFVKAVEWVRNFIIGLNLVQKVGEIADTIEETIETMRVNARNMKIQSWILNVLGAAAALWLLADALTKLSSVSWDNIGAGLTGMAGVMGVESIFLKVINDLSNPTIVDKGKRLITNKQPLLTSAATLYILGESLMKLSTLTWDAMATGLSGMLGVMGIESIFLKVINVLSNPTIVDKGKRLIKNKQPLLSSAGALYILGEQLQRLSTITWEAISTGLMGMLGVMGIESVFLKVINVLSNPTIVDKGKRLIKNKQPLLSSAGTLYILGEQLQRLSTFTWDGISTGLMGMLGVMGIESVFLKVINVLANPTIVDKGKRLIKNKQPLLSSAGTLYILGEQLQRLSTITWEGMAKGLTAMLGIVGVESVFLKAIESLSEPSILEKGKQVVKNKKPLLSSAAAIYILGEQLQKLAGFTWEEILKGLTGEAGIALVLSAFITVLDDLQGKNTSIKAGLSTAIRLEAAADSVSKLTDSIVKVSELKTDQISQGLLTVAGLFIGEGAFLKLLDALKGSTIGEAAGALGSAGQIMALGQSINMLSDALVKMSELKIEEIGSGLIGVGGLLALIIGGEWLSGVAAKDLGQVGTGKIGEIVDGVANAINSVKFIELAFAVDQMATGVEKLAKIAKSEDADLFSGVFAAGGLMGGLVVAADTLSTVNIGAAIKSVASLAIFLAGFEAVFTALGALTKVLQDNGIDIKGYIGETAEVLREIGNAFGSLIGGFMQGVFGQDEFSEDTKVFELLAESLQKFGDVSGKINFRDADKAVKVMTMIGDIAGTMSTKAGTETGMSTLQQFFHDFEGVGASIGVFGDELANFDVDKADTATMILERVIGLAKMMQETKFDNNTTWEGAIGSMLQAIEGLSLNEQFGRGLGNLAANTFSGFAEALLQNGSIPDDAISQVINTLLNTSAFSVPDFESVGYNISQALGTGIYNGSTMAYTAIETVVENMLARARTAAGLDNVEQTITPVVTDTDLSGTGLTGQVQNTLDTSGANLNASSVAEAINNATITIGGKLETISQGLYMFKAQHSAATGQINTNIGKVDGSVRGLADKLAITVTLDGQVIAEAVAPRVDGILGGKLK